MQLLNQRGCMRLPGVWPAGRPADTMYGVSMWQHAAHEHGGVRGVVGVLHWPAGQSVHHVLYITVAAAAGHERNHCMGRKKSSLRRLNPEIDALARFIYTT